METATWDICRDDFAFDGALIDLLVPGSGPAEWELFWSALLSGPFTLQAFKEDKPIPLPESAAWFFAEWEVASVGLSVFAGPIKANCHFFDGDLELDIDPREVLNDSAFESVLEIMRFIAAAVRLPVYAVAEGGSAAFSFLRVSPNGRAEFLPEGSIRRA